MSQYETHNFSNADLRGSTVVSQPGVAALVKDYQMPALRVSLPIASRFGQASDNTQGRKPLGRGCCG